MLLRLFCILLFCSQMVCAQKQNNNWCFGDGVGIDFNTATPICFQSQSNASEGGAATISSRHTGRLLFYTDGTKIWDSTHTVMPNGNGIGAPNRYTCAQGSVIIPNPGDSNKFYVFTHEDQGLPEGAVFYSVVDITLNSGRGDIISGQKMIKLDTGFVEGMTVASGCDGQWLIVFGRYTSKFTTYKISKTGIGQAVTSQNLYPVKTKNGTWGGIKVSPDSRKIAFVASNASGDTSFVACSDFNPQSGLVTNGNLIDLYVGNNYYSCAFSSNSTKLYVGAYNQRRIYQFDVSLPTIAAISASKKLIQTLAISPGDLQLGPDSNIYVSKNAATSIDLISNTNSSSPIYKANAVVFLSGTRSFLSLPQTVHYPQQLSIDPGRSVKIDICNGESKILQGKPGALSYIWSNNDTTETFTPTVSGQYLVTSSFLCGDFTDTFIVNIINLKVALGNDTAICAGNELTLDATQAFQPITYSWSNGSVKNKITINKGGVYYVTASSGTCAASDTIEININDAAVFYLNDTTLCLGDVYHLQGPSAFTYYKWNTGDTGRTVIVDKAGLYFLTAEKMGCKHTDTVNIYYDDGRFSLPADTFLCEGEQITVNATSLPGSTYTWSNDNKNPEITISAEGTYIVSASNRCGLFTDSITADFEDCECKPFVPSFTPNSDGINDALKPLFKCIIVQYEFFIFNRFGQAVFRTKNPEERWDGTYKGQKAEMGTYFYQLRLKNIRGIESLHKGDLILIR